MLFSASSLVKLSAKAVCYYHTHDRQQKNTGVSQKVGNEFGAKLVKGMPEMRGSYKFNNHIIYYCFDDIRVSNIIRLYEFKSVQRGEVADWYLNNSILQTAYYHALAVVNPNKDYITAKFYPGRTQKLTINKKLRSILIIGDKKYKVVVKNAQEIVKFFERKAVASLNYNSAEVWDAKYKHKEFDALKKYIRVIKL